MAFVKKEALIPLVEFETVGQEVEGTLVKLKTGKTQYGDAQFAILEDGEGKQVSVCISSSMALHDWSSFEGEYIKIVYTGEQPSKNRKNKTFKTFDLYVDDGK